MEVLYLYFVRVPCKVLCVHELVNHRSLLIEQHCSHSGCSELGTTLMRSYRCTRIFSELKFQFLIKRNLHAQQFSELLCLEYVEYEKCVCMEDLVTNYSMQFDDYA